MAYILVADDDDILAELVQFRLEGSGHEVQIAEDGEAALEQTRARTPDLIVLDSMMPILSGPEVLRTLRAEERFAKIPVLMLTARNGQEDIVGALRGGASEYMTKPFIPEELLARVEKLLASAASSDG
ncbi:response regulator transcription factor [Pseudoblastomonas halimionae]|uniref:Response regulator n=1 Tax=Alteriqipengyuania halimionae TaxID=1926630 RepID=A0A6I4U6A2_9SPHN|nr:response regulator [Alteriqipengyuania halimionae]MXP10393.1 response regulator [Alteriqipengyuania halimionae]